MRSDSFSLCGRLSKFNSSTLLKLPSDFVDAIYFVIKSIKFKWMWVRIGIIPTVFSSFVWHMSSFFLQEDDEFLNFTREQFIEAMVTIGATGSRSEVDYNKSHLTLNTAIFVGRKSSRFGASLQKVKISSRK